MATIEVLRIRQIEHMLREGPFVIDAAKKILNDSLERLKKELDELSETIRKVNEQIQELERVKAASHEAWQKAEEEAEQCRQALAAAMAWASSLPKDSPDAEAAQAEISKLSEACRKSEEWAAVCKAGYGNACKALDDAKALHERLKTTMKIVHDQRFNVDRDGNQHIREARNRFDEDGLRRQLEILKEKERSR